MIPDDAVNVQSLFADAVGLAIVALDIDWAGGSDYATFVRAEDNPVWRLFSVLQCLPTRQSARGTAALMRLVDDDFEGPMAEVLAIVTRGLSRRSAEKVANVVGVSLSPMIAPKARITPRTVTARRGSR